MSRQSEKRRCVEGSTFIVDPSTANTQITEQEVRNFLRSLPEFKETQFDIEIMPSTANGSQAYLTRMQHERSSVVEQRRPQPLPIKGPQWLPEKSQENVVKVPAMPNNELSDAMAALNLSSNPSQQQQEQEEEENPRRIGEGETNGGGGGGGEVIYRRQVRSSTQSPKSKSTSKLSSLSSSPPHIPQPSSSSYRRRGAERRFFDNQIPPSYLHQQHKPARMRRREESRKSSRYYHIDGERYKVKEYQNQQNAPPPNNQPLMYRAPFRRMQQPFSSDWAYPRMMVPYRPQLTYTPPNEREFRTRNKRNRTSSHQQEVIWPMRVPPFMRRAQHTSLYPPPPPSNQPMLLPSTYRRTTYGAPQMMMFQPNFYPRPAAAMMQQQAGNAYLCTLLPPPNQ